VGDAPDISRRLVGKLWFVFTQALAEADHCDSPDEILRHAWGYGTSEIFALSIRATTLAGRGC
jgi:hypothetical protein